MSDQSSINGMIYGGFGVAFLCLLFATIARKVNVIRWLCFIGAFLGLIYEGGCMMVLGGIGTATGGNSVDSAKMMDPVAWGFMIAFAWGFILIVLNARDERKDDSKNFSQNDIPSENANNENQNDES